MTDRPTTPQDAPTLRVRSSRYQPTKADLEEDPRVDATFEEAVDALTRTVRVRHHRNPEVD